MAPKAAKGKKDKKGKGDKNKGNKEEESTFEPVVYITDKPATMIEMLDSPEPKLLLRVIGTLCKAAMGSKTNLAYMLDCGLYKKMVVLLKSPDIYTIRFTISLVQMVCDDLSLLENIELADIQMSTNSIKEHYLTINDGLVRSLTSNILLNLSKFHSLISDQIYSVEVVDKILVILKTDTNLELALQNLELLFYILNSPKAEKDLFHYNSSFIECLVCLLGSTIDDRMRSIAVNILHKIAMWKRSEVLQFLGKSKVIEAMMRLLFAEQVDYNRKVFETIYVILSEDICAVEFSKCLEFVQFLEWVINKCSVAMSGYASSILRSLSQRQNLLQVLYDFSAEASAISLFRFLSEPVILNVCDIIMNMIRHRYCCEKMARPSLMKILVEIINDNDSFPMVPYGERALKTLHKFFQCHVKTRQLVYESGCINMLVDIFCKAKQQMHEDGYLQIIEIIQYLAASEFYKSIRNIEMYQTIIDMYRDATFEESQIVNIIESFVDCEEFRELLLERKLLQMIMERIKNNHNSDIVTRNLVLIKKLIVYKKLGVVFLNEGYLPQLKYAKSNWKFKTYLIEEIIDALYDFCLTIKFFYKKKLHENDKIRNAFVLVPDALLTMPLESFKIKTSTLSAHIPIYVVNYDFLVEDEKEATVQESDNIDQDPSSIGSVRRSAKTTSELCPYHRLTLFPSKLVESSIDLTRILTSSHAVIAEDTYLTRIIEEIYEYFHEYDTMYLKRSYKVKYIAKYVAELLSGRTIMQNHPDKKHAYKYYIRKLIRKLGTNFVPIGVVKFGFQMERALLFKVVCDMTRVSTTLRKDNDCYYNEIAIISNARCISGKLVQQVFIVDLMEHIGGMMQEDSQEAKEYLVKYRTTINDFY